MGYPPGLERDDQILKAVGGTRGGHLARWGAYSGGVALYFYFGLFLFCLFYSVLCFVLFYLFLSVLLSRIYLHETKYLEIFKKAFK